MNWFRKAGPSVLVPAKEAKPAPVLLGGDDNDSGWISVKDHLPEFDVRVLAYSPDHGVLSGHRVAQTQEGDRWSLGKVVSTSYSLYPSIVNTYDVTHWAPLPGRPQR